MQISSTDLATALEAAVAGGYVAEVTAQTFTVTSPIVINVTTTITGPLGIDLGGAHIVSQITDGSPIIQINVGPGVDLRYLTFSNFTIDGNGREGDGIKIVAAGNDRWLYNFTVDNVTVNNVGGYGLDVQDSVFEGLISHSSMIGNGQGGAYFGHLSGGQVSALRWFGGTFENNGSAGIILGNGARDISVDGVSFVHNNGVGISAEQGITSVTDSQFTDNKDAGIWFQNFGNFSGNTFTNSGMQGTGVTGWLNGGASVIDNTSVWTGSGNDPTVLANLQGYGHAYMEGDVGRTVTGSNIFSSGVGAGNNAEVIESSQGVALPTLEQITAATTAALANSTGSGTLETTLRSALANGTVAELSGTSFTVTSPIVINLARSSQGPIGIDLGGAKILSQITNGAPVIEIIVGAGVDVGSLTLTNFMIQGNGQEGAGIKIVADGADRSIKLKIEGVNIEHVGGIGIDAIGNVSGTVFDSWMHGNLSGGARFANSTNGGTADNLQWIGGGFRKNGVAGLILDNGTHDMAVQGAYFVDNDGPGIDATNGIALVQQSGFENNSGVGALVQGAATFVNDTFSTYGVQQTAIGSYLSGQQITLIGTGNEYYGWNPDTTVLANIQGSGTLSLAGGGKVIASSGISMSGLTDLTVVLPPDDATPPAITSIIASGPDIVDGAGNLGIGKTIILTVTFGEAAIVSGGPSLELNDGDLATYVGGSGTTALTFSHIVQTGQNTADLAISSLSLNGATIKDAAGNAAVLSGPAMNPAGILRIDTVAPAVSSIATAGAGIAAGSGTIDTGAVVTVTVVMNETVVVTGTPILALNDGGTATYTSGSGSMSLTFNHVVQSGQSAADLTVTGIALNGGTIRDAAGNAANFSAAANYNPTGVLKIDTTTFPASSVSIVELSAVKPEGHSGTTSFTFTVALDQAAAVNQTVNWSVTGSGAHPADGSDFVSTQGTVTIATGATSAQVTVSVVGDTTVEANEGLTVTLSNPTGGATLGTSTASGTIQNDDDFPVVSIAPLSAVKAEGDSGTTTFTFTVSLSEVGVTSQSVKWAVTGSGANSPDGTDFVGGVLPFGVITFAPGETTATISVAASGDTVVEFDEFFTVMLSNPSAGLTIGTASAVGDIQNEDRAHISVAPLSAVKAEGNSGTATFTFTVSLEQASVFTQSADWTVAGSGINPANVTDFGGSFPAGTVTFAPGETTTTITVPVSGDSVPEFNEDFAVTLSNLSAGLALGTGTASGTILNDDSPVVSITTAAMAAAEGNSGTTPFAFTVSLDRAAIGSESVNWAVTGAGLHPVDAGDFGGALPSGTLSFAPGETSKTVTIPVVGDSIVEFDDTFVLTLSNPSAGLTLGTVTATGTILNDDPSTVSIVPLSATRTEGNGGTAAFTFTVSLDQADAASHSVDWTVVGFGTLPADASDFGGTLPSGTVTFTPGETSKTITVGVSADTVVESDEEFTVTLSHPSAGVTIGTGSATCTIQNDDGQSLETQAYDDAYVTMQGEAVTPSAGSLLLNDEGTPPFAASLLTTTNHGVLRILADGGISYAPDPGFAGIDSFTYRATGAGGSDDGQALIYVVPVLAGSSPTLNLLALTAEEQVAATYTTFFGRGADAGGFNFWVNEFNVGSPAQGAATLFANIASSFGVSDDAKGLYPFLANPNGASDGQISAFLDTVYNNLFNRSSDPAGLAYWTGQIKQTLATGKFVGSVLVDIISGTQVGADVQALMGKVAVGLEFVHQQDERHMQWNGASDQAAATTLLHDVTSDPQSVLVGVRQVQAFVAGHDLATAPA